MIPSLFKTEWFPLKNFIYVHHGFVCVNNLILFLITSPGRVVHCKRKVNPILPFTSCQTSPLISLHPKCLLVNYCSRSSRAYCMPNFTRKSNEKKIVYMRYLYTQQWYQWKSRQFCLCKQWNENEWMIRIKFVKKMFISDVFCSCWCTPQRWWYSIPCPAGHIV